MTKSPHGEVHARKMLRLRGGRKLRKNRLWIFGEKEVLNQPVKLRQM